MILAIFRPLYRLNSPDIILVSSKFCKDGLHRPQKKDLPGFRNLAGLYFLAIRRLFAYYPPQHPPPAHAAGLGASVFGQYPSLYQPLPFRLKAVAEIIFFT
jgi:hypothetical protein